MNYVDSNDRYNVLFEPVTVGPVKSKNRFYQVPHCNGGGYRDPSAAAEMRGIKSQGGWGVIFTEQCEMHHTSEITPFIELRLWDDADIPMIAKMADRMKEYGALAGIQLAYSGINGPNLYTKEVPLAVTGMPIRTFTNDPVSARSLDKEDIKDKKELPIHRSAPKFDETIDVSINLGVDPRHADQLVRGTISMPNGTGKNVSILVLAKGEMVDAALKAGADFAGSDEYLEKIKSGWTDVDSIVSTPEMMPELGKHGRVLGPRGLMPNPKLGTVTNDVAKVVKLIKSGQIEIKNDKDGNLSTSIGKKDFSDDKIKNNFNSVYETITKEKPTGLKGNFILSTYLTSTMGISYKLKSGS